MVALTPVSSVSADEARTGIRGGLICLTPDKPYLVVMRDERSSKVQGGQDARRHLQAHSVDSTSKFLPLCAKRDFLNLRIRGISEVELFAVFVKSKLGAEVGFFAIPDKVSHPFAAHPRIIVPEATIHARA